RLKHRAEPALTYSRIATARYGRLVCLLCFLWPKSWELNRTFTPSHDFYLKPSARSNRIRDMSANRDSWMFALTVSTAASVLVSIAAAETLLAIACVVWLAQRQHPIVWPSYVLPLCAFMATTTLALLMSPQPEIGIAVVRKFVLFPMGLLAANF